MLSLCLVLVVELRSVLCRGPSPVVDLLSALLLRLLLPAFELRLVLCLVLSLRLVQLELCLILAFALLRVLLR